MSGELDSSMRAQLHLELDSCAYACSALDLSDRGDANEMSCRVPWAACLSSCLFSCLGDKVGQSFIPIARNIPHL